MSMFGCNQQTAKKTETTDVKPTETNPANIQPEAPKVSVLKADYKDIPKTIKLKGILVAYQLAEVRPQVTGIIKKRLFIEGSYVQEGQPLFQIDDKAYKNEVASGKASLQRHQANLTALKIKKNGLKHASAQQKKELNAQIKLAEADIKLAKSLLDISKLNLKRTVITAPISGKTSLSQVGSGSLASVNQANPLLRIHQFDPIYVDIYQPITNFLEKNKQVELGVLNSLSQGAKVSLLLSDGEKYGETGRITFASSVINPEDGAIRLRAVFNNEDRQLLPGMRVDTVISHGLYSHALLIPKTAIIAQSHQHKDKDKNKDKKNKKTNDKSHQSLAIKSQVDVFIVDKDNKLQKRNLRIDGISGNDYVITQGIQENELIVKKSENLTENMLVDVVTE